MRRLVPMLVLLPLLSACATYAPGDDKQGLELQAVGQQVLRASRTYMDENARPPHTLDDLVPRYLKALPKEPHIVYDTNLGRFDFVYRQAGSEGAKVECHAVIGETDWICTGIYDQRQ